MTITKLISYYNYNTSTHTYTYICTHTHTHAAQAQTYIQNFNLTLYLWVMYVRTYVDTLLLMIINWSTNVCTMFTGCRCC